MTEEKYLGKIENDIQERMYDILMVYLQRIGLNVLPNAKIIIKPTSPAHL